MIAGEVVVSAPTDVDSNILLEAEKFVITRSYAGVADCGSCHSETDLGITGFQSPWKEGLPSLIRPSASKTDGFLHCQ